MDTAMGAATKATTWTKTVTLNEVQRKCFERNRIAKVPLDAVAIFREIIYLRPVFDGRFLRVETEMLGVERV